MPMLQEDTLRALLAFRRARDWEQFHNLRSQAMSISIEAAELLELVQWAKDGELDGIVRGKRARIEEEVADIAIYLAVLVNDLGLDIDQVVRAKLAKNEQKYPVEKSRGVSTKYDEL